MTQNDAVFAGSIPQLYDRHLGPALFAPYAADLAVRLAGFGGGRLLETAAGTGIVTAALAAALPDAAIVATDLNQPMLDHAAAKPGLDRVEFRQADAMALPFPDRSFDAVVCQFGVMFMPDRPAAYREAARVLRGGGRFLFNVWSPVPENPVVAVLLRALSALHPRQESWFLERTPHGHGDPAAIAADLAAAGLTAEAIGTRVLPSPVASAAGLAMGFCQGTPMRAEIEALEPGGLDRATAAAAAAIAAEYGPGPFEAPMSARVVEVTLRRR
ncbi:methyltransferase domain-containing protein [Dankookia rubra]|uniref:Methyltransferase domain-containing protein n=1 Tax=Dankookia rubra TaxID=1442381 RepID=A0A4R5Q8V2_9PROT|nr:methyltransferase domain-containing protein [Dankookia rubra]TDH59384.1 methyltransferase domain-containing protein [Dankookia rubra]